MPDGSDFVLITYSDEFPNGFAFRTFAPDSDRQYYLMNLNTYRAWLHFGYQYMINNVLIAESPVNIIQMFDTIKECRDSKETCENNSF